MKGNKERGEEKEELRNEGRKVGRKRKRRTFISVKKKKVL